MEGNITEEQFKKFCKDFVEKYEGRSFPEIIGRLGKGWNLSFKGNITNDFKFYKYGDFMNFGLSYLVSVLFCYVGQAHYIFINTFDGSDNYFHTIEDLYKFFKMDYKETKEPSNISKVTFDIPIETIKEDYVEMLSKKHNLNKESIELKIIM